MAVKKGKSSKGLSNRQKLTQAKKLLKQAIAAHQKSITTLKLALQHTHDVERVLAAYGPKCPPEKPTRAAAAYGPKCPPEMSRPVMAAYGPKCPPQP
jgi:hypothetical protein